MLLPLSLRAAAVSLALVLASGRHVTAAEQRADDPIGRETIELILPRQPNPREAVWLEISTGNFNGGRIRILTSDGILIGTVSPFGRTRSQAGVTYKLPLPQAAIVNGRVRLRLEVDEPGMPPRAPRHSEIDGVMLIYVPVSD